MSEEIEPIAPELAREALDAAILERLGENWDDEETGWLIVQKSDYLARLTRSNINLDFYVDLLGDVRIEEKQINLAQDSGRIVAWMLLGLSVIIAILLARIAGFIG